MMPELLFEIEAEMQTAHTNFPHGVSTGRSTMQVHIKLTLQEGLKVMVRTGKEKGKWLIYMTVAHYREYHRQSIG